MYVCRVTTLLTDLLCALEHVETPVLEWFSRLGRLVVLDLHAFDCIGLPSQEAGAAEIGLSKVRLWFSVILHVSGLAGEGNVKC